MVLQFQSADDLKYNSAEGRAKSGYRVLKVLLSLCLVLGAVFALGHVRATAYADDAASYDRIYYFNMDSKGLQGNMMLVETTDANGVPHWGLLDAGHRYAKTIQDDPDNSTRSFSTKVHGLSSQIYCRNGKDVAQYMINVLGVTHLDFIIGTHAHSDHVGGIPELVATTFTDSQGVTRSLVDSTTTYYYKEYQHISNLEDDLAKLTSSSWHNQAFAYQAAKAMEDAGATLVDLSTVAGFSEAELSNLGLTFVTRGELGDEYGDSVEFTVGGITFRLYNLYEHTDTGGENVNSIVAVMSNGQYTVVNLADIDTDHGAIDKVSAAIAEAYGTVDIVVAGHHGATGSNTKEMFDQLQPEFVVVSNGSSGTSWFYTTGDLAAAIPYANARYGTDFYSTAISYYATVTDLSGNAVHIYSVNDAGALEDAMSKMLSANKKKTGWVSWAQTDGTLWSYLEKGNSVKDAWRTVSGKRYHFDEYGIMQTGWTDIDNTWYYLNPKSGAAMSGWRQREDGSWYYMSSNSRSFGKPVTGWQTISKKRYYFNESGVMLSETWIDGHYLSKSGAMTTGWFQETNGDWYYLNKNSKARTYGKIVVGWQTIGGKKYYFEENGVMKHDAWQDTYYLTTRGWVATGLQEIDGETYYFDPNTKNRSYGRALSGWRTIKNKRYYFDDEGHMVRGWLDDTFYLKEDGTMATGWLNMGTEENPVWYYMDTNAKSRSYGRRLTGWRTIGGKKYYFDDLGVMAHDTWMDSFYLTHEGPVATGWQEMPTGSGSWYYFDPNTKNRTFGRALTGWRTISSKRYYFDDEGRMLTGWLDDTFYLKTDGTVGKDLGSMVTGWKELPAGSGNWYYFDPNAKNRSYGRILTGWRTIGGKKYYFDDLGIMAKDTWMDGFYLTHEGPVATGWQEMPAGSGSWYYFDPDTKNRTFGRAMTGWRTIDKKRYCFDDEGRMLHGTWQDDYYLGPDGVLATGLVKTADGNTYYLNPNAKAKNYGRILTGWQQVSGKWYFFDDSGRMLSGTWTDDGFYLTAEGPMAAGCWQTLNGKRYYFNVKGNTLRGWQTVDGKKYFFNDDGSAAVNTWTEAGWLDENGAVTTGLVTDSTGRTYYLDAKGNKLTGWQRVNGTERYFGADGVLTANVWAADGRYAGGDGSPASGMMTVDGVTYCFYGGSKLSGWQTVDGVQYYFGADGGLVTNAWASDGRYVSGDGTVQTGWKSIDGAWYYFEADGSRHTGWLDDNGARYYFDADGVMVTGEQTIDGVSYYFNADGSLYVAPVVQNTPLDDGGSDDNGSGETIAENSADEDIENPGDMSP